MYDIGINQWIHVFGPLLYIIMFWSLFWKGLALWHAGRRGKEWWFIALLVVNTLGILEIVYLFAVEKIDPSDLFSKKTSGIRTADVPKPTDVPKAE